KPSLDFVMDDTIKFYPSKFKAGYKHWMENVRDWCISRQLWWGQRIPAWYDDEGKIFVAETAEEAEKLAGHANLRQDEDVLDTWFSSWLWPISVFDGILDPDNEDIKYYYPTNDLVTAPEILFFWVARMIMSGYEYRDAKPFSNVYLTGIVRDDQRRKMSKQLGNSPDPLKLMKKYSADGVRTGMLFCSPAGNDLLFDEALCEQGRNFCNKIWNSLRLIKGWEVDENGKQEEVSALAVDWFNSRFNETLTTINDHYSKFRMSDALMSVYKLIWDDFCSWYLEAVKPGYEKPIDGKTYAQTIEIFENVLKVLHPFMPFISEEIWHTIGERGEKESLVVAAWPEVSEINKSLLGEFEEASELIKGLRTIRKTQNIAFKESIRLIVNSKESKKRSFDPLVSKLINIEEIEFTDAKPENSQTLVIGAVEYFVPMSGEVDVEAESEKLQSELEYTKGFLNSVVKKLGNEKFVNNAPESVVTIERKKQSEAEERIAVLEKQLASLN
ncbi:MAG: class I tRNA ligase family protein, partial [Flavobacteriales bacterium]|nr:class I tRNA ligase family protein [Flavobacteriales bacterium]